MKHLSLLVLSLFMGVTTSFAQTLRFKFPVTSLTTNVNGQPINKGDEFIVDVWVNPNGNTTTRGLYFDFEYQNTAYELVNVSHTGTGGTGGVIPYGSQITLSHFTYPGYSWLSTQQNSVENGNLRYQNANYTYTQGGPKTILRAYLTWTQSTTAYPFYEGTLLRLRFRLKADAPGFSWDPIRMNFVAAFNQNGSWGSTIMDNPLTSVVSLDPLATALADVSIDKNSNLDAYSLTRVLIVDSATNQGFITDALSDGKVPVDQTRLQPNTTYRVMMMVNMDSMKDLYNAAITVSDYTAAQNEFITQNLDGTFKNTNIKTGMGYFAADVNRSKTFDGGDLVKIFSQSVSVDQLLTLPQGYQPGQDFYMSQPTFTADVFNNLTTDNWKDISEPWVTFRTGEFGSNKPLKLKYVLWGDINRSHSSQVVDLQGQIQMNGIRATSSINTPNPGVSKVTVDLNNQTVTSNVLEIPIKVNTNGANVSGLQFEFTYDATKIKFEEVLANLPNGWFVFGSPKDGKIKFGAVDKELKAPVTGEVIPFKLKFSTLTPGVDLTTSVRVTPVMDASDNKGNQLGITLNSTTIKLTGINKFK